MHLIILAGGRNSRIQTKKALLSVGGQPMVERLISRLGPLVTGCLIVTGDSEAFAFLDADTAADRFPGKGPLGGLEAGLAASPEELNLAVACDMPFVSRELAAHLLAEAEAHPEADAVVPCWEKGREPLFALYRKRAAGSFARRLEEGDLRLGHLASAIAVREVEITEWARQQRLDLSRAFWNVNTWAEWRQAEEAAREEEPPAAPPVLAVVGWQDAGKTTLTTALVSELHRAGLSVAVVKHDPHGHETDIPGKDTYLHRAAGADVTVLAGPRLVTVWQAVEEPRELTALARELPRVDLILAEGWKREAVPRVVVLRPAERGGNAQEAEDLARAGEVLAVVGEGNAPAAFAAGLPGGPPVFTPGQTVRLAEYLLGHFGLARRS